MTVRELARLDKEKSEEIGSKKRVRRLKKESCSLSLGDDSLFAEQPLVKGHSKKLSSDEMKKEKAQEDWIQLCKYVEEMSFEGNEVEA